MARLGSDAEQLFPFSALESELTRHGNYALVVAALMVMLTSQAPEDTFNVDKMVEIVGGETPIADFMHMPEETQAKYNIRMRDVILDLDRLGYLD